jgi:transposase
MKQNITIGMDLGDKKHTICELDADGRVINREAIVNTEKTLRKVFSKYSKATVVIETGAHSPWISHVLKEMGHTVIVANSRKVKAIYANEYKTDAHDAETLGRLGRFDRSLLKPVHHRSKAAYEDLALIKARDQLIKVRTQLINHTRGSVKTMGSRIRKCSTDSFHRKAMGDLPIGLLSALAPILKMIGTLTERIKQYDKKIEKLSTTKYPETIRLRQIPGVGPVTALAYVLTLEEPGRGKNKRSVGPYLGLVPRKDQSSEQDKQLPITKTGNGYLRRLLVGCSQYILGPFGPDSDLRRFGERLAARGGKNAKRRAVVAVARKLAILLYVLWDTGVVYEPLYNQTRGTIAA